VYCIQYNLPFIVQVAPSASQLLVERQSTVTAPLMVYPASHSNVAVAPKVVNPASLLAPLVRVGTAPQSKRIETFAKLRCVSIYLSIYLSIGIYVNTNTCLYVQGYMSIRIRVYMYRDIRQYKYMYTCTGIYVRRETHICCICSILSCLIDKIYTNIYK